MEKPDTASREAEVLRERLSALSGAILRINASLDVDSVLHEVVDSARALTGARYGAIVPTNDEGNLLDFVTSGFAPDQRRALMEWSEGPMLFRHLYSLAAPLRLLDLDGYVRSLGHAPLPLPYGTFLAMPMRHCGVRVGVFFLGEKEGAFTDEDEETLVLFASQAGTAVTNARRHGDERRTRADLEALVETSPVGVLVFDVTSGLLLRVNREARRIVSGLSVPGLTLAQLASVLTCRRGDGREVTLDHLGNAETLRSEEVELSAPDGRSLRTLISATPSLSQSGEALSMVVTMQDLAPLEELERARAEFLGMVSHELRAPLTAVKGSATTVLTASRSYEPAEIQQFFRIVDDAADRMDRLIGDLLDMGRIETGTLSVNAAPMAVEVLLDRARNVFLGGRGRHPVRVDLRPDLPRVAADERRIVQVLNNLMANAARHSPESASIRLAASRKDGFVEISVADSGEGVTEDQLKHLFRKQAGGRSGLGLAICKGLVEAHGGRIRAESGGPGLGTRIAFTLPQAMETGEKPVRDHPRPTGAAGTPILVVDDDPQTTRYVRDVLSKAGYAPFVTGDPEEVPDLLARLNPPLVLMDLMLPNTDGIELMLEVAGLADRAVIFISAYGRDETIARALEAGACDYIVKPFSPTELTARVRTALRGRARPEPFTLADLVIDYERRQITVAGREVPLTPTEYELLRALSASGDRVLTYDALLRRIWPHSDGGSELVRTFVKKLRAKLGDNPASPRYVVNVRGVGYRMASSDRP